MDFFSAPRADRGIHTERSLYNIIDFCWALRADADLRMHAPCNLSLLLLLLPLLLLLLLWLLL